MDAYVHSITESVSGHLEPRDVMDFLYQEHALSEEDMELVNAQVTRKGRCCQLIKQLAERKDKVKTFRTFMRSLREHYWFLTEVTSKQVDAFVHSFNLNAVKSPGGKVMCMHPITQKHRNRQTDRNCLRQTYLSMVLTCSSKGRCSSYISRLYDHLSTELNRGEFLTFEAHTQKLMTQKGSADVKCLVLYLQACQAMFRNDTEGAGMICRQAQALVPKTTDPLQHDIEIMSVIAWRYVKLGKLNKLNNLLTGALQQIHSNPVRCSGKIAGWIYVDHVHMLSAMLESANPKRARALRKEALNQIQIAIQHFDREKGKDGPFGRSFSWIMCARLLLQCGNQMQFATLRIAEADVRKAERLLRKVENAHIGIPDMLRVFYSIAMSDLFFRKGNNERAAGHAKDALRVSTKLQIDRESEFASIRVSKLSTICDSRNLSSTYLSTLDTSYSRSSQWCGDDSFRTGVETVPSNGQNTWIKTFLMIVQQIRFLALIVCIGVGFPIPAV